MVTNISVTLIVLAELCWQLTAILLVLTPLMVAYIKHLGPIINMFSLVRPSDRARKCTACASLEGRTPPATLDPGRLMGRWL